MERLVQVDGPLIARRLREERERAEQVEQEEREAMVEDLQTQLSGLVARFNDLLAHAAAIEMEDLAGATAEHTDDIDTDENPV